MPDAIVGGIIGSSVIGAGVSAYMGDKAAQAQKDAAAAGIGEQRRQFNAMQQLLQPYVTSGRDALNSYEGLLGLNGTTAQQRQIAGIASSPEMAAYTAQGENAMLQNASATGGLRGGNLQGALAQFRPQLLAQLINQRYQQLGNLSQMGQASAAGVGAAGMQTGTNVANLMQQQGAATAGGYLNQANAVNQAMGVGQTLGGMYLGSQWGRSPSGNATYGAAPQQPVTFGDQATINASLAQARGF